MKNDSNNKQEQFLRLLMHNDRNIYAYILSMVPNVSDADDIMQETTVVMWRKFDKFIPEMNFIAWGLTIAKYQVLSFYKKQKNSKVCFSESLINSLEITIEKSIPGMEVKLEALNNCVKKLDEKQKYLLKLRYDKKLTFKEIGANISKSTRMAFYTLSKIHQTLLLCVNTSKAEESC